MLLISGVYGSTKDYMQVTGLYVVGGKIFCGWEKLYCSRNHFDCSGVPTYRTGSSEDHARCQRFVLICSEYKFVLANGCVQPQGCRQLCRYRAWSNEPLSWVATCSVMVGRSWLGNKPSLVVQGRSLRALSKFSRT